MLLRDPAYRSSVERLLDVSAQQEVAVQTIKAIARRRWEPGDPAAKFSWYEPLPPGDALTHALAYVLANPQLFLNTSSDANLLEAAIAAAQGEPLAPSEQDLEADVDAMDMTPLFDGKALERI